jgi:Ca2+-binding RTX toxin-like protein
MLAPAGDRANSLSGTSASDIMFGLGGNDWINGRAGNDMLYGGEGNDTLIGRARSWYNQPGGSGNDVFVYGRVTESGAGAGARDLITDFVHDSDVIDLLTIDKGRKWQRDQGIMFAGENTAVIPNTITWFEGSGNTIIQTDVTRDNRADFAIFLTGTGLGQTASDFLL